MVAYLWGKWPVNNQIQPKYAATFNSAHPQLSVITLRLQEDRQCILVLMGATEDGRKELIAVADGFRESEQSWKSLLLDAKARGLVVDPKLATGDGALGFWKALPQVYRKRAPPPVLTEGLGYWGVSFTNPSGEVCNESCSGSGEAGGVGAAAGGI
jgi:hypothetical protein